MSRRPAPRTLQPTPILDYHSATVQAVSDGIRPADDSAIAWLRAAHGAIARAVAPIYTVRERQPVSATLARQQGSCSQRLACLEALARRHGIATRVRAIWVAGAFWNRRFPLTRRLIPDRILLAWPSFGVDGAWIGAEDLFGPVDERARGAVPFTNDGETLFEALQSTVVDFAGRTATCSSQCDLSGFVVESGDVFERRDDLFAQLGSFEDTWRGRAFELLYAGRSSR